MFAIAFPQFAFINAKSYGYTQYSTSIEINHDISNHRGSLGVIIHHFIIIIRKHVYKKGKRGRGTCIIHELLNYCES